MIKKPLVSINIPTFNSSRTLKETLESVKNQTYKNIEIIIADGGSKDDTLKIAKDYNVKNCFGRELGKARYEALRNSMGYYILALDSDQIIDKFLVQRAVEYVESKNYDALILNEESFPTKSFIGRLLLYDKHIVSSSQDADPVFGAAIPRFFKRRKLLDLDWPTNLSILDDAIFFKKNRDRLGNIGFLSGKCISHNEIESFLKFFKKFMRYGRLYISTLKESPGTTLAHSLPRRSYLGREVIFNPKVLFGLVILYSIKASAVSLGIIIELLSGILNSPRKSFL